MRRFAHIALLLLVFGLGLGAGAWFSIGRRAAAFSAGVEQRLAESAHSTPAPVPAPKRTFSSDEEMLTALMSAVAEDEPLLRAHRLHRLLGRLDSAELAVLFDRVVRVDDRDRRGMVLGALLARWAALDPAAAAEAVRPYLDRYRATVRADWRGVEVAVSDAWAEAQPEAALAEAMTAPNAAWARNTARIAIQTLAEGDPARQLDMLAHLPANRLRAEMCESVIKELAAKDTAAAEEWLDSLPEPRQRARVQAEILGKLAERDPAAGLARFAALAPDLAPGTAGTLLIGSVLRAAAKKDPAAALAAAGGLPEALRSPAIGAVLVGWAGEKPAEALEWAAANGVDVAEAKAFLEFGDRGNAGWNSLLGTAFDSDRAKTVAWLRTRPPSPERDAMLRDRIWSGTAEQKIEIYAEITPEGRAGAAGYLAGSFYRDSPERAEAWVKGQPAGAVRAAAVRSLTEQQAGNAPERLDTLAAAWTAGPDGDAAMRGISASLAENDPHRALDFARRVGSPAEREATFEGIAQSWLYRDEPAARAWITSAPELSAGQKRVLLRQFDER